MYQPSFSGTYRTSKQPAIAWGTRGRSAGPVAYPNTYNGLGFVNDDLPKTTPVFPASRHYDGLRMCDQAVRHMGNHHNVAWPYLAPTDWRHQKVLHAQQYPPSRIPPRRPSYPPCTLLSDWAGHTNYPPSIFTHSDIPRVLFEQHIRKMEHYDECLRGVMNLTSLSATRRDQVLTPVLNQTCHQQPNIQSESSAVVSTCRSDHRKGQMESRPRLNMNYSSSVQSASDAQPTQTDEKTLPPKTSSQKSRPLDILSIKTKVFNADEDLFLSELAKVDLPDLTEAQSPPYNFDHPASSTPCHNGPRGVNPRLSQHPLYDFDQLPDHPAPIVHRRPSCDLDRPVLSPTDPELHVSSPLDQDVMDLYPSTPICKPDPGDQVLNEYDLEPPLVIQENDWPESPAHIDPAPEKFSCEDNSASVQPVIDIEDEDLGEVLNMVNDQQSLSPPPEPVQSADATLEPLPDEDTSSLLNTVPCLFCPHRSPDPKSFIYHHKTHYLGRRSRNLQRQWGQCPMCSKGVSLTKFSAMSRHIKAHLGEFSYSCDLCQFRCFTRKALTLHEHNWHNKS